MAIGQNGHSGVTVAQHVLVGKDFATELAVIRHLAMAVKTVQGILLILDIVTLCHVLSMVIGQLGHDGVTAVEVALVAQNLDHELAATLPRATEVKPALGIPLKQKGAR